MSTYLTNLSKALEDNNEEKIIELLKCRDKDVELKSNKSVKILLRHNNNEILNEAVEAIAEWAKLEPNRLVLTDEDIVKTLLNLLNRNVFLVLNVIRLLGNICYENEAATKFIDKNGMSTILDVFSTANHNHTNTLLLTKTSGLLLNLLVTNEYLRQNAIEKNLLINIESLMNNYIDKIDENESLYSYLLSIINAISESCDDQSLISVNLCSTIVKILKSSTNPEICITCLEILHSVSERDDIKNLLARTQTCELIFELIEKYKNLVTDEDTRSMLKIACDLIFTILTGDDCITLLYDNGNGNFYKNVIKWLDSDDVDILCTAVLAIGNFARNDEHCIGMMNNGILKKLIVLLSKYNSKEDDVKIQHALLSTLKNLVIPTQNKAVVIKEGLIDVIYPIIETEQDFVMFKLLGTFRMAIDGQDSAALDLICRREFIEKIIYWCYNTDHLGVRGEVPRLLSWLIKNCHSFEPFQNVIDIPDAVKCLVEMLSSNHAVMQNEAIMSIYLLTLGCPQLVDGSSSLNEQLCKADIGNNLNYTINKYFDKFNKQSIENLVNLIEQLVKTNTILCHLQENNIDNALRKLLTNDDALDFHTKINKVLLDIEKQ